MTHHRARVRAVLSVGMALAIALTGNGPGFAQQLSQDASATSLSPQSTFSIAAAKSAQPGRNGKVSVIVELEDASLASYSGGVQGLAATNPRASGGRRLNVASVESKAYLGHLAQKQASFEAEARRVAPSARVTQRFDVVVNGVAMTVDAN